MIKIAIFGHSAEYFLDEKSVSFDIDNAIISIARQHLEKDYIYSLNGEPGISQWFCDELLKQNIPYEMYLSSTPDLYSQYWLERQQKIFQAQLNKSKAIHIFSIENDSKSRIYRDMKIVDDSQWVLVFWNKKHQGVTYQIIEYALKNNKLVFNGLGGLKLLDNEALKINKDIDERL